LQSESGRSTPTLATDRQPIPRKEKEEYDYEMEIYKLSTVGPQKKENLCQICEQTGELLECTGPCQGFFHTDCLGITASPEGAFKCDECTKGGFGYDSQFQHAEKMVVLNFLTLLVC